MTVVELSVMVWVLLPVFLVSGDPQADPLMSGCVRRARNSSLVVISPSVLSSVLAGAGSDCRHCFTLLDNDQPILQGCWTPGDGCNPDCLLSRLVSDEDDPAISRLKFCCCSSELCNLKWREGEEEERQTTRDINRKELTLLNVDYVSLMITTISLSVSLVLLTFVLVSLYYGRRSQKNKILEKFYSEKVCLISNKI